MNFWILAYKVIKICEDDKIFKTENINDIFSNYATASKNFNSPDSKPVKSDEKVYQSIDEYFIEENSGEELAEWSDLAESSSDDSPSKSSLSFWDKMTAAREDDEKAKLKLAKTPPV